MNSCSAKDLENVGFDKSYSNVACNKYVYKNLKIFGLTLPQANILKQTAISHGADCALHREVITNKIEKTDCILGGSVSQLRKIAKNLLVQPFSLKDLSAQIIDSIEEKLAPIKVKQTEFDFSRPYIVGILNLTTNSFSDGGMFYDFENAKNQLLKMIDDGADMIDIGAESAKPYSTAVSAENQLEKILPILDFIRENNIQIPMSIDTRSSIVAEESIKSGADIINDVSGFEYDEKLADVVAKFDVPVIIQHTQGAPENMQDNPVYENLVDDIYKSLNSKIELAQSKGIKKQNIIIDLGIGFGKTREQNFELLSKVDEFKTLNSPIMMGISRKSLLNMPNATNEEKDIYTLALNSRLMEKNVNFLRVHNVALHRKLLTIVDV